MCCNVCCIVCCSVCHIVYWVDRSLQDKCVPGGGGGCIRRRMVCTREYRGDGYLKERCYFVGG